MNLKKVLALLSAAAVTLSLTACGVAPASSTPVASGSAAVPASTGEKVKLRMAWWGSQTRHDITQQVIDLYESQNANIDIEAEFYDFDGYFNKLNTLVASNDVWDIFQLGGNFPTYIDKIVPLDAYVESGVVDVSNTTEMFLNTTMSDGKLIGLSSGVNCYGIAYDPAMFTEADVPQPTDNWTWDDWKSACLTIHEKLGIYGSSKMDDFIAGASMGISQEDFKLNFFALSNDKLGFDDATMMQDYFAIRKELVDAGAYPDPGAISEIKDIEGDFLVTGEAAMTWVASNQMPTLAAAAGREIKMAVVPRKVADGPSGATIQSSQMLCISQDSAYPEEVAKFISFFQNDAQANAILNGERGVPIMSNVREVLLEGADAAKQEMYDFVDKIGSFETGEVNVISPAPKTEIEDQYKLIMDKVVFGELTPEQAAQELYTFAAGKF